MAFYVVAQHRSHGSRPVWWLGCLMGSVVELGYFCQRVLGITEACCAFRQKGNESVCPHSEKAPPRILSLDQFACEDLVVSCSFRDMRLGCLSAREMVLSKIYSFNLELHPFLLKVISIFAIFDT